MDDVFAIFWFNYNFDYNQDIIYKDIVIQFSNFDRYVDNVYECNMNFQTIHWITYIIYNRYDYLNHPNT